MNNIINWFKYFFSKKYRYYSFSNILHIKKCHKIQVFDDYICITYFGFKKNIYNNQYTEILIGGELKVTKVDIDIDYESRHEKGFNFILTNCVVGNFSFISYERGFLGICIHNSTVDYMFLQNNLFLDYKYNLTMYNSTIGYLNTDGVKIKGNTDSAINKIYIDRFPNLCIDKANIKVDSLYINRYGDTYSIDSVVKKIGVRYLNYSGSYVRGDTIIGQTVLKHGKINSDKIECLNDIFPYIMMFEL